jgi:hypothetical protein
MEALAIAALKMLLPILLTWAGARFDQFVRSKVKNEKLAALLMQVDDAAAIAVLAVAQTYADGIDRNSDGKISSAEASEAKRRAMDEAKRQLGPDAWEAWCKVVGGKEKAEEALGARVEAAVRRTKVIAPLAFKLRS